MNSRVYWATREAEQLRHNQTEEKAYMKEIEKIHRDMLDEIQREIESFYGRYASKEGITLAEAKKRVSELDIKRYERKAKRYVKEKNFSKEANEEMRLYNLTMKVNRLEMLKANIGLELIAGHNAEQKLMQEILQGRTEAELARQAGILGKTVRDNAKKAHAIVNASFHNGTFSDRIWANQVMLRSQVATLLQTGLIQGKNPRVLASELKKTFDASTYNAERLMRTELARVQTEAQKQSFVRNGFEEYTFHSLSEGSGTCPICLDLDGKHFKIKYMMPGTNAPPMHPNCRCSTSAYEDSKEYEAWLDHLANGGASVSFEKRFTRINPKNSRKTAETLENAGKSVIFKLRKTFMDMKLQHFANGKERAEKYENNWKKTSLQEVLNKFAPGVEGEVIAEKGKIIYKSKDGRYQVVYDYNGDYFRIEDNQKRGKRRYVDLEGNDVSNVEVNGKTRGRTREEYESATHFKNTDFEKR